MGAVIRRALEGFIADYTDRKKEPVRIESYNPEDSHESRNKAVQDYIQIYQQNDKGEPMKINNDKYQEGFTEHYANDSVPVWDIGEPQQPFIELADQIRGPLLDIGCGTGSVSLFFAARGEEVTGIDFVKEAVARAREKARTACLNAEFIVADFFTLIEWDKKYNNIIDSGLFHIFSGDEERKSHYVNVARHLLLAGGRIYLLASKKEERQDIGVTEEEIRKAFAQGWKIEQLKEFQAKIVENAKENIPGHHWKTFFAVIQKVI
jgi:SAM-dependent methyltransferase